LKRAQDVEVFPIMASNPLSAWPTAQTQYARLRRALMQRRAGQKAQKILRDAGLISKKSEE